LGHLKDGDVGVSGFSRGSFGEGVRARLLGRFIGVRFVIVRRRGEVMWWGG